MNNKDNKKIDADCMTTASKPTRERKSRKKLEYLIITHDLIWKLDIKTAIIFSLIHFKVSFQKSNNKTFKYSINYIHETTGIHASTIKDSLVKLSEEKLLIVENDFSNIMLGKNSKTILENIRREYIAHEQKNVLEPGNVIVPFVKFDFECCKKLKLTEKDYFILHTSYILCKNNGYGCFRKQYFKRILNLEDAQLYNIRKKLVNKKYLEIIDYQNSNIKIPSTIRGLLYEKWKIKNKHEKDYENDTL